MQKTNRQKIDRRSCRRDHHVHVPEELVFEILLRLPVKSLIRFKIVCKCWYNLITSSNCIRNHLGSNNCTRILTHYHLQSRAVYDKSGFAAFEYESLAREFNYSSTPFYMQCILGPVNGLFLLGGALGENYRLTLFNPATRELRTLSDLISNKSSCVIGFGFGFDPLTNDFKVVVFWEYSVVHYWAIGGPLNMAVYSLANDSWKRLSPCDRKKMHNLDSHVPYYNGACYWLSNKGNSIVSFDFSSEVVREINGPQNTPKYDYAYLFIYNYESLAMFGVMYANWRFKIVSIDLLVMKEEGCWTKHLTVDVSPLHVLQPLCVWKNDKLLLESCEGFNEFQERGVVKTKMVLYDPITREIKELEIQPQEFIPRNRQVFIYNESLVSLKRTKNQ